VRLIGGRGREGFRPVTAVGEALGGKGAGGSEFSLEVAERAFEGSLRVGPGGRTGGERGFQLTERGDGGLELLNGVGGGEFGERQADRGEVRERH
jgi:hypothetical protein